MSILMYFYFIYSAPTTSFPSILPSLFLTCCAILPTSFGGK